MTTLYSPKRVVIFALFILNVRALDTFVAAVYEHAIILPNRMEKPVSKEEALLLMNKNIDILEDAVKLAAKQVLSFLSWLGCSEGELQLGNRVGVWNS